MYPQLSSTAVDLFSPQIVGSLLPLEEFDAPVCNPFHQEQVVAGMTTQHMIGNPDVQDQVIVQDVPGVVERIQERILDPIEVFPLERVQHHTSLQIMHMPVPQTQEQSAVTDLVNPPISIAADEHHTSHVTFSHLFTRTCVAQVVCLSCAHYIPCVILMCLF